MALRRKTALIVLVVAAVLIAALLFVVPALLNVDRHRPEVIAYLEQKSGKQIEISQLAFSLSPVSIRIDGLRAKNPREFPRGYAVQVTRIDAEVDAAAL